MGICMQLTGSIFGIEIRIQLLCLVRKKKTPTQTPTRAFCPTFSPTYSLDEKLKGSSVLTDQTNTAAAFRPGRQGGCGAQREKQGTD